MGLTRLQGLMLVLAFLTALTEHLLLFSYSQLLSPIVLEMNLTFAEGGFIFSICLLALILLRIPWGVLCDRLGFRASAGLGLTLMGVFGLLRGFAVNYGMLLVFQLFLGVGLSAVMPSLPKLVATWFPHERAGFAVGGSISGFSLGGAIGLSATPHLLTAVGTWRNVFYVYGAWTMVLAVVWWCLAREPDEITLSERKVHSNASLTRDLATLLKTKQVWLLSGLYLTASTCYDTVLLWLPSILKAKGLSPTTAGLITSMLPFGFLVASLTVGTLSDRAGLRKPFLLVLGLVTGPAIYAVGTAPGPAEWMFAFIIGFSTIGVLTLVLTIPLELAPTSPRVASAVGLISSIGNIGSFLIPTVVGQIRDLTGSFTLAILLLAVIGEFTLVLSLLVVETGRKKSRRKL
ncbi:MAG: nitrate/nitrite transporter [Candidatus Bathyarchaeia archaeon]